ncbi:acyl carrier protein [Pseudorhodoferax sp.]|uniref:acyl carrier protein n=1 Tax=Pseudorhodoferax sp. TaxID=1993553 RepID=UPI002DD643A1|nr:phosphopantetheine-binding protein [Pseudorhodoferax sp.]
MTMSSLPALQALIHSKFGIDPATLQPDTSMRETGFDSLALVEFVFAVEDQFGISVPDDNTSIDTLAEFSALVDRLVAAKQAAA